MTPKRKYCTTLSVGEVMDSGAHCFIKLKNLIVWRYMYYENAFAAIPLLVSFIPMLMDTGGNCGSQSSILIIRGLALDEVRFSDFFRVVFKEFQISIILGIVLATAIGLRLFIEYHNLGLALVIALSLIVTVTLSKIIGCTLPAINTPASVNPVKRHRYNQSIV